MRFTGRTELALLTVDTPGSPVMETRRTDVLFVPMSPAPTVTMYCVVVELRD